MLFETKEDLAREAEQVKVIESRFQCRFHKLPIHWKLDGFLSRMGYAVGICELKNRRVSHNHYPTIVMSKDKLEAGLKLTRYMTNEITKIPLALMLFYRFVDGDFYTRVNSIIGLRVELLNPKNHHCSDKEKVVHIPVDWLKPF